MDIQEAIRIVRASRKLDYQDYLEEMDKVVVGHQNEVTALKRQTEEAQRALAEIERKVTGRRAAQVKMFEKLAKECEEQKAVYAAEHKAYAEQVKREYEGQVRALLKGMKHDLAKAEVEHKVGMARMEKELTERAALLAEVKGQLADIKRRL